MGRIGNIQLREEKKRQEGAATQPTDVSAPSPMEQPLQDTNQKSQMQEIKSDMEIAKANKPNPYLDKMTWQNTGIVPTPGNSQEYRTGALRDMDVATFKANQDKMNASENEYWSEQVKKDPANTYAIINQMYASSETPAEKAKREKRERLGEVFRGLGNVIGNAANLYYAHRGGIPVDLNTSDEKRKERMQKIKDKQDALAEQTRNILLKAKLGDIEAAREVAKEERAAKAKEKEKASKFKMDIFLKELDNKFKLGQIDAQTKAALEKQAAKTKDTKDVEALKHSYRVALKQAPSYGDSKVVDSAISSDGSIWTRNSRLTDNEAMQIVQSSVPSDEMEAFITSEQSYDTVTGQPTYKTKTDWRAAAAYALQKGYVSPEELEQMGFKKGKSSRNEDNTPPSRRKQQGTNDNTPPSRRNK